MAAVTICSDFGAQENQVCHCFHCFPIYLPWSDEKYRQLLLVLLIQHPLPSLAGRRPWLHLVPVILVRSRSDPVSWLGTCLRLANQATLSLGHCGLFRDGMWLKLSQSEHPKIWYMDSSRNQSFFLWDLRLCQWTSVPVTWRELSVTWGQHTKDSRAKWWRQNPNNPFESLDLDVPETWWVTGLPKCVWP